MRSDGGELHRGVPVAHVRVVPRTQAFLCSRLPVRGAARSEAAETRITFPAAFAFGTATAAYQVEGAYQEGG